MTGMRIVSPAGLAYYCVGLTVGPGRVQIAVTCPGRVESVTAAIITMAAGEKDPGQRLRLLERAVVGNFRFPRESVAGVGWRGLLAGH